MSHARVGFERTLHTAVFAAGTTGQVDLDDAMTAAARGETEALDRRPKNRHRRRSHSRRQVHGGTVIRHQNPTQFENFCRLGQRQSADQIQRRTMSGMEQSCRQSLISFSTRENDL